MPKWKKGSKVFTVGVNYHETRGYQSSIPRPVMDALGEPDTITFILDEKGVRIEPQIPLNMTDTEIKYPTSYKGKGRTKI